jgi:integrase
VLGHIRLTELNETDVEGMFAAMRLLGVTGVPRSSNPELTALLAARKTDQPPRPLSPSSQRRIHATLRAALNTALKRRLIAYNPALHIELPSGRRPKAVVWNADRTAQWRAWRDQKRELTESLIVAERKLRRAPRGVDVEPLEEAVVTARQALLAHVRSWTAPPVAVWTPAQTGQFLDSIEGHRLYALYHLIAFRGLRRGEAVGLPWTNVDLDKGFLTVSTQIVQLGWATEVASPKADSEGVVALDRGTVEVLRTHRERQDDEAATHPTVWRHTGLVFTREDGTAIHPELVSRTFDRLVRDADLPPIRLHDLRHGAATLALAAGVDLKVVSAMLRHSSITITADTYVSVLPETARAAAEAAAAVVPRHGRLASRQPQPADRAKRIQSPEVRDVRDR